MHEFGHAHRHENRKIPANRVLKAAKNRMLESAAADTDVKTCRYYQIVQAS